MGAVSMLQSFFSLPGFSSQRKGTEICCCSRRVTRDSEHSFDSIVACVVIVSVAWCHGQKQGNAVAENLPEPSAALLPPRSSVTPEDEIRAVARQNPEPGLWAVLTAISKNAGQRRARRGRCWSCYHGLRGREEESLVHNKDHMDFQILVLFVLTFRCRVKLETIMS